MFLSLSQGKPYRESAIGRRGNWIWRFKCGLGRNPRSPWELEDQWLEREKIREGFFFLCHRERERERERERDGIGQSDKWKWEREKWEKLERFCLNENLNLWEIGWTITHTWPCAVGGGVVGKTRSPITCSDHVHCFSFSFFFSFCWIGRELVHIIW